MGLPRRPIDRSTLGIHMYFSPPTTPYYCSHCSPEEGLTTEDSIGPRYLQIKGRPLKEPPARLRKVGTLEPGCQDQGVYAMQQH